MALLVGEILQASWDDRPIRVMMADDTEVFDDALFPGVGWNLHLPNEPLFW